MLGVVILSGVARRSLPNCTERTSRLEFKRKLLKENECVIRNFECDYGGLSTWVFETMLLVMLMQKTTRSVS